MLRRTNYGEADRILQLITPEGRRSVMARGVRKEKSRLAGGIELFAVCDVVLGKGKGELDILTSARLVQFYRNILKDYERMQFCYEVLKQVAKASEMVDEPEWYDVAAELLMALDSETIDLRLSKAWFYLHHARLLGYELSLQFDSDGQKIRADTNYTYDVAEKSLRQKDTGELSSSHIKLLRLIAAKQLRTLAQVGGLDTVLDECERVAHMHAAI